MASSIELEIVEWANSRHGWQKELLARVFKGEALTPAFIDDLASRIVAGPVDGPELPFVLKDLPTPSSSGAMVQIRSLSDLVNVNSLLESQTLSFGEKGLTVVYGDNGSGKSGYARLLKELSGARHKEAILPNVFGKSEAPQQATVEYEVDGVLRSGDWPTLSDADLRQIHFWDEACSNDYLVSETELSYRPSVLGVFDLLIRAIDQVRAALDVLVKANTSAAKPLPVLSPGTTAHAFLRDLTGSTADADIDAATALLPDAQASLAGLMNEEVRLSTTDPNKEKARLLTGAQRLDEIALHFDDIEALLSVEASTTIVRHLDEARALRSAAEVASSADFANEPLSGVGTATWRALWTAAEHFARSEALPDRDFPATSETDRCPLCQQVLLVDGRERLNRFHAFVHNEIAQQAAAAEAVAATDVKSIRELSVSTVGATQAMAFLVTENQPLAIELQAALDLAEAAKGRLIARLKRETEDAFIQLAPVDTEGLRVLAADRRGRAERIDDSEFQTQLSDVIRRKTELADRMELAKYAEILKSESVRLKRLAAITSLRNQATTGGATSKVRDLTRAYVTVAVDDRFARESEHLGLERVVLDDHGGDKGKVRHKPALIGTDHGDAPEEVLSEGEQTALGLAGLFTEIAFDKSGSAVILDDPINSLDHSRREKVARHVAALAGERQVVVFTHDLTFLGDLVKAAESKGVPITERAVARNGSRVPGQVFEDYPWKAKDSKQRLGYLDAELARIKKAQPDLNPDEYERQVATWAGGLSETWERMVRSEIVNKVVDRSTTEVRPKMVRMLALITEADNADFQDGYSTVSKWALRHDKSEETNYTAPTPDELRIELDRAIAWRGRIVGYAN